MRFINTELKMEVEGRWMDMKQQPPFGTAKPLTEPAAVPTARAMYPCSHLRLLLIAPPDGCAWTIAMRYLEFAAARALHCRHSSPIETGHLVGMADATVRTLADARDYVRYVDSRTIAFHGGVGGLSQPIVSRGRWTVLATTSQPLAIVLCQTAAYQRTRVTIPPWNICILHTDFAKFGYSVGLAGDRIQGTVVFVAEFNPCRRHSVRLVELLPPVTEEPVSAIDTLVAAAEEERQPGIEGDESDTEEELPPVNLPRTRKRTRADALLAREAHLFTHNSRDWA